MSKLYIKQKVFSWADHFTVKNEVEEDRYLVEGEVFSFGKRLHILDMLGNEQAEIRQKLWTWLPRYTLLVRGEPRAEIVKAFSFKPRYTIEGTDWEIEGDFWGHDYRITQRGKPVAAIRKAWFTWGDSYELELQPETDELLALAVVLAIDCVESNAAAAAAASN